MLPDPAFHVSGATSVTNTYARGWSFESGFDLDWRPISTATRSDVRAPLTPLQVTV